MTWRNLGLAQRFDLYCRHITATKRPIILGPWRSEVGFEALYWLPFLAGLIKRYGWTADRLVAFSRGGAGAWYGCGQSADLYAFMPPETIRIHTLARMQRTGSVKQTGWDPWERHVVGLAAASLGLSQYHVIHPSWMYRLLAPYWEDKASVRMLAKWLRPDKMPAPALPSGLTLPEKFTAVRFYVRPTWEAHENVQLWTKQLVQKLSDKQPVILLNSAGRYDDHADLIAPHGDRILDISKYLTPQNNLAVQSAVLAKASLYVGTYGGLSQLAVRLGVPTIACYTTWHSTALAHLDLTMRLSVGSGTPFWLTTPKQMDRLIGAVL